MICWIVYLLGFVLESDLGRATPENGVAELSVPTSQRKIARYLYHLLALRGFALSRFVAFGESRNIICMYKFSSHSIFDFERKWDRTFIVIHVRLAERI